MDMSAEEHYLNAIEALEQGDRETALKEAKTATKIDPEHVEAWQLYSDVTLPLPGEPISLIDASRSLSAVRKVVELEPTRIDMWVRGGRLLADELGLLMDALQWWQDVRHYAPNEVTPLIEQATILADMGLYEESRQRLETIINENMDVATTQYGRIHQLLGLVRNAANQDTNEHFKPWEKRHAGWTAIEAKMKKQPASETFIFMLTTVPILFAVILLSNALAGQGWGAFCLTSLVIFITVLFGMRIAKNLFRSVNRPAFNLLRAMNFEASTGFSVIPENVRTSVLCMYIMQRKPLAWQERMLIIIEEKNKIPKNWKLSMPDFESHYDEMGLIEDDQEENSASKFWEE
jgi:tetratricopeptide (TPR) repeat protein